MLFYSLYSLLMKIISCMDKLRKGIYGVFLRTSDFHFKL